MSEAIIDYSRCIGAPPRATLQFDICAQAHNAPLGAWPAQTLPGIKRVRAFHALHTFLVLVHLARKAGTEGHWQGQRGKGQGLPGRVSLHKDGAVSTGMSKESK